MSVDIIVKLRIYPSLPIISKAFQVFDSNRSGSIDVQEIRDIMKEENITEAEMEEILDNVDLNGDGQIEYNGACFVIFRFTI